MSVLSRRFISQTVYSIEEFVAFEQEKAMRYDFFAGKLKQKSGGTFNHASIIANIGASLIGNIHREELPFLALMSSMKVFIKETNTSLYPDVLICEKKGGYSFPDRDDFISNPIVIFEVLAPDTIAYDTTVKFPAYMHLTTFKEYVLVNQFFPLVEVRTLVNVEKNGWKISFYENPDDIIHLESVDISLTVADIYRKIKFTEPPQEED